MQTALTGLERGTQPPPSSRLMRGRERTYSLDADREEVWELVSEPDNLSFWHGLTRLDRKKTSDAAAPASHAQCAWAPPTSAA